MDKVELCKVIILVSFFGRGPVGAIDARIANIQNRRAPQTDASQQTIKDLLKLEIKLQV